MGGPPPSQEQGPGPSYRFSQNRVSSFRTGSLPFPSLFLAGKDFLSILRLKIQGGMDSTEEEDNRVRRREDEEVHPDGEDRRDEGASVEDPHRVLFDVPEALTR
jgi:hypothetical protein